MKHVVAIFGPTGSGKTDLAVEVAARLDTEVVNADPAQCYAGLPILSNQPTAEHDAMAPHRLVGCWGLDEVATVHRYAHLARTTIDELLAARGCAVVCGGSGFYQAAALRQLSFARERSGLAAGRNAWDDLYDRLGPDGAHARLAELAPAGADRIHPNDRKRVVRALELAAAGESLEPDGTSVWDAPYRHLTHVVGIVPERARLRERIDLRTRAMFDRGVVAEVADQVGARAEHMERLSVTARRIHGVPEIAALLAGTLDRDAAIRQLAANTRRYARRQLTWMRRWPGISRVDWDSGVTPAREVATLVAGRIAAQHGEPEADAIQQMARHRQ